MCLVSWKIFHVSLDQGYKYFLKQMRQSGNSLDSFPSLLSNDNLHHYFVPIIFHSCRNDDFLSLWFKVKIVGDYGRRGTFITEFIQKISKTLALN